MRSRVSRASRREARSTRCPKSNCPRERPTPISSSAYCAPKVSSRCTDRDSAPRSKTASSASSSSRRSTSSAQSTTMSPTSPQSSDPRSLIRYACVALAVTITLLWALYLVRAPLLVIYVSALFSTGLAPLVAFIERQRIMTLSKRRLPRPLAILVIYATVIGLIVGIGAAVLPPMVAQSQQFWKELPIYMDQAQQRLSSWGLISPDASFKELQQHAPAGSGDAV